VPACREAFPQGPNTTAHLFNAFRENAMPNAAWNSPFRWQNLKIGNNGGSNSLIGGGQYVYPAPGFGAKGEILELVHGTKFDVGDRKRLALDLKPHDLKTSRIEGGATVAGATAEPAAAGLAECARRLNDAEALLNAWGAALPKSDPDRQVVVKEVTAGRAKLAEHDLRGAILVSDGWRLRTALQKLLPPPGYAVAAAPVAALPPNCCSTWMKRPERSRAPAERTARSRVPQRLPPDVSARPATCARAASRLTCPAC
jgi:hypothetical protein